MTLGCDTLMELLAKKQEEVKAQGNGELGKVNKLVEEFLQMKVPHGSEILDVAAGSGILSCLLQLKGYSTLDALDENMDVIRELKALNLYREYIPCAVKGVRSTGLNSSMYDVVITAGGFAKDAINPLDITELIRILRPEGHLLWTMRAAQDEHSTEFGLLLMNLRGLEKSGKISIIKHEQFVDYDGVNTGEFYLIKRLPGALPYFANRDVPESLKTHISHIVQDTTNEDVRIRFFDEWSEEYEDSMVIVGNYSGHIKCCEAFLSLNLNRCVQVLDLACGTGLLGDMIASHGYVNIDGLDSSLKMLDQARIKTCFKEHILASIDPEKLLPLADDIYDVVVCSNGFAPGQIYPEAIEEILRIIKPGGYLLITMKDGLAAISPSFARFDNHLEELNRAGKCEVSLGPVIFEKFVINEKGVFYMIRKSKEQHLAYAKSA